ncbi:universal stress protein [Consotaella salsifontis]|uniref:Nucleotide-binding universal stress protein, UspA family n=1 Tax=Consotaella salsifontis TaxID=1365950 RepID=A0A1T4SWE7_9HYPH|nr:universal stress protein [Consotaella salsifontis]SKA32590.1 Nucleotide-binding universal stress protein, UspA family [Consotaella salsifontis]
MTKILVCIDGSEYSKSVCDHAAWAATALSADVLLFHVLGHGEATGASVNLAPSPDGDQHKALDLEQAKLDEQSDKLAQKRGRLLLEEAKARLQGAGVKGNITIRLRHGDVADTVNETEEFTDLVMIGKRGEGADFAKAHLGSNLERVVRGSAKPVLVTSRAFRPVRRALIAFDGGPAVMKAVDFLVDKSLLKGVAIDVVMAGSGGSGDKMRMEEAVGKLKKAGYSVQSLTLPGEPEKVISGRIEAEAIDLLVMGAFGHGRIRNFFIGSTTTEMVRTCKVPVLLVR